MYYSHCSVKKKYHHYIFIIVPLWLTSHPRSTVVLLETGTPGTSRRNVMLPVQVNRDIRKDDVVASFSIDKCCRVTCLSTERTDHHVLLKALYCSRSLICCTRSRGFIEDVTRCNRTSSFKVHNRYCTSSTSPHLDLSRRCDSLLVTMCLTLVHIVKTERLMTKSIFQSRVKHVPKSVVCKVAEK